MSIKPGEPLKVVGVELALGFYLDQSEYVYPRAIMMDPTDGRVIFEVHPERDSGLYCLVRTDGCGACEFFGRCPNSDVLCSREGVCLEDLRRLISVLADVKGFDFEWVDGSIYRYASEVVCND